MAAIDAERYLESLEVPAGTARAADGVAASGH
jgi:hypothetical protein